MACGVVASGGCATEANTLEPNESDAGERNSGGKQTSAGSANASGGKSTAFGGTGSSTAGSPSADAGEGGSVELGMGGMETAGAPAAGTGGTAQAGTGGSGGSGASGGSGNSGGESCVAEWQGNVPCDTCSSQTQGDKKACIQVLNCFIANDCGPATCTNSADACGPNAIGQGAAPYPIAQEVYDCMCK